MIQVYLMFKSTQEKFVYVRKFSPLKCMRRKGRVSIAEAKDLEKAKKARRQVSPTFEAKNV